MQRLSILSSLSLTLIFLLCLLQLCASAVNPGEERANKFRRITFTLGQKNPAERTAILLQTGLAMNAPAPAAIVDEPNAHGKRQRPQPKTIMHGQIRQINNRRNFGPKNMNRIHIDEQQKVQQQSTRQQQLALTNSIDIANWVDYYNYMYEDNTQSGGSNDLLSNWVDNYNNEYVGVKQTKEHGIDKSLAHFVKHNGCYHLVNNGFVYKLKQRYPENMNKSTWKCEVELCPAFVNIERSLDLGQNLIDQINHEHNHKRTDRLVNSRGINDFNSVIQNPSKYPFEHEGYIYLKYMNRGHGRINVRCSLYKREVKCPARAVIYLEENLIDVTKPHNHDPGCFTKNGNDEQSIAAKGDSLAKYLAVDGKLLV